MFLFVIFAAKHLIITFKNNVFVHINKVLIKNVQVDIFVSRDLESPTQFT